MRTIKFRAWHSQLKEMRGNHTAIQILEDRSSKISDSHNGLYELMQFTGLLDKNGKEIYEGDVIGYRGEERIRVIKWSDEYLEWIGEYYVPSGTLFESFWNTRETIYMGWEIIGNIYENPELLSN